MHASDGPFSNAARNLGQIARSPVCLACFAVVMFVQFVVSTKGGPEFVASWYENLGLSRSGILSGKIWQIFSYGLLHGGWWHAGLNGLFVLMIGSRVEYVAGRAAVARVVVIGILGGGVGHLILGTGLLVGMSGGCVALLLCLTTLSPQSRMFPLPVSGRSLGLGIILGELMLALIDPGLKLPGLEWIGKNLEDAGMSSCFRMGHACHFGGGMAGWACGRWILRPRVTLDRLRRDRARREAG